MYTLEQALMEHELIVLRVIGEWWELDLTGQDQTACAAALAERLSELDLPLELQYLPPEEGEALRALIAAEGRLPVATFSRRHSWPISAARKSPPITQGVSRAVVSSS